MFGEREQWAPYPGKRTLDNYSRADKQRGDLGAGAQITPGSGGELQERGIVSTDPMAFSDWKRTREGWDRLATRAKAFATNIAVHYGCSAVIEGNVGQPRKIRGEVQLWRPQRDSPADIADSDFKLNTH